MEEESLGGLRHWQSCSGFAQSGCALAGGLGSLSELVSFGSWYQSARAPMVCSGSRMASGPALVGLPALEASEGPVRGRRVVEVLLQLR
jgi:hypothetical protein